MFAGKLLERVDIQTPSTSVGTRGQRTGSATVLYSDIPASVRELSGRSLELARQYLATATHDVMIRWHDNITEQEEIIWGDRTLAIGHIRNTDNRKNWLIIVAEEKKL